ncbi:MAG TPA: winged helix DNA-binding domain-containing protein [Gaiella sp.]|nr:winged helix DNA-binding domain-containing protein [Gaiella sp.]
MRRIGVEERRARLVRRHRLSPAHRADEVTGAARSVVALHSTDPATVFLSAWARTASFERADLERALYEQRSLVRMLGMRRTLWVVPRDLVPVVDAGASQAVAANERRKLEKFVAESGITDEPAAWIDAAEAAALAALGARGEASTSELAGDHPLLAERLRLGVGTNWETEVGAASRVLLLLAAEGKIVRARPRGGWTASQYRWVPVERLGPLEPIEPSEARARLLELWLEAFGPATEADLRWWTGWTARDARAALAAVPHAEVDLKGATGYVLAGDLEPEPTDEPAAALLPSLDPTTMGWKERGWYLGPHAASLFDRNGNAGPTVWWGGTIVGGWARRQDGELAYRMLEDVGADGRHAVAIEAERLAAWLGEARLTPRFRTPLQRELSE